MTENEINIHKKYVDTLVDEFEKLVERQKEIVNQLSMYRLSGLLKQTKKEKTTGIVKYLNEHYNDNDKVIINFLNRYIHSSHCIRSMKPDKKMLYNQPSYPKHTVQSYKVYYDAVMEGKHKSGRIQLYFTDGTCDDIGLFKFKKYLRRVI